MAAIINQMLRVIPKQQKIRDVDCFSLCSNLVATGGELWERVQYYVNEKENCLDIKFKSRKGQGELGIEGQSDKFDIWTIMNYEGGSDIIFFQNGKEYNIEFSLDTVNLYCFDEVRIIGDHDKLRNDFYKYFFGVQSYAYSYFEQSMRTEKDGVVSFKVDGIYNAGTIYNVGDTFLDVPELLTKEEFHEPRNVSYWEANFFVPTNNQNYEMKKIIEVGIKDKFCSFEWDRSNLIEIQLCFEGRVVKKVETGDYWKYFNAEFFDNTVERKWLDYLALLKRGLIY